MKKNYFFLLLSLVCLAGRSSAQSVPCVTDEMYRTYKQQHPQIAEMERIQEENIKAYSEAHPRNVGARTTAGRTDTDIYYIPVVFHVMHNYGYIQSALSGAYVPDVVPDAAIYGIIAEMNRFYSLQNNVSAIIPPFRKYIGKANIQFYLATTDPNGNPTNGITHHRTYLTYGGDDQAKMDLWSPSNYYNIWAEAVIGNTVPGGTILAYANFPSAAAVYPFNDGVIVASPYVNDGSNTGSSTLDHETGHYFNLLHTWNSSGKDCGVACGDDGVDDTPPTKGHYSTCTLYDTACAENYFKQYSAVDGSDSLVNYPDTTNTQNTMDYSYCTDMFTKGQVTRMHAALNSSVGGRSNLWDSTNLIKTGVGYYSPSNISFVPMPRMDLKPVPEFSATPPNMKLGPATVGGNTAFNIRTIQTLDYFVFPGAQVQLTNYSWNDTITAVNWQFPSTATPSSSTSMTKVNVSFADQGWADVKMTVTGNGSGDTTADFPRSIFVAAQDGTPGAGYVEEFSGADTAQWPMFNYYNNEFKWQYANVGYDDSKCVMYTGFDSRTGYLPTGMPRGDFDDLFSIPLDLSSGYYPGPASLNFYYAGASRSSNSYNVNDTLYIDYSTGKNNAWTRLAVLAKNDLCNMGATSLPFVPTSTSDWSLFSMDLPAAARTPYTVFRFRYMPGTELAYNGTTYVPGPLSSGNNFYMDRLTVSPYPAGIGSIKLGAQDVVVAPNPTTGDAFVIIKDADNTTAKIVVTDITGKVVYTTNPIIVSGEARVTIPHAAIAVQGMYLVTTSTGNQVRTQKLVVE